MAVLLFLIEREISKRKRLASILKCFEHLQILDLSYTIYGARCMLKLGSTGKPKLRELLVDCCPGVTNSIVKVFCNGQSSLKKLSVRITSVTHIGVRFAIEHLPEMKELGCDNESDIPNVFRSIRNEAGELKKYSLTKFSIRTLPDLVPYKKGNVSLMVDMCPSLVDLFLSVINDKEFTNEELLGFRELQQLKYLGIGLSFKSAFSIRGGVIPLLQARGLTLEELHLSKKVTSEEVYLIIEYCPNIRRLLLAIVSTDLETPEPVVDDGVNSSLCSPKEEIPLRMLEVIALSSDLYFSPNAIFAISRKLLLLLFSSPTLTVISIEKCSTLDDQIIKEACARNSFKYLTKLSLYGCSNVSQKGIDFFLNEANPLSKISVQDCGNVNLYRLMMMAEEKHWNIKQ